MSNPNRTRKRAGLVSVIAVASALALSIAARPASAEGFFLAGASAGSDGSLYGYAGAIFPLFTSLKNDGLLLRVWGEGQRFDYNTVLPGAPTAFTETNIDADGFGIEAQIGYQIIRPDWRVTGYVGPKYRNIDLSPNDAAADVDNEDLGIKGQVEIEAALTNRFDISLIGSYVLNFDSYWVRARPGYRLDNGLKVGPEFVALGGEKWDKTQVGLFVSGIDVGAGSVGLKGGVQRDARANNLRGYVGLSYSLGF